MQSNSLNNPDRVSSDIFISGRCAVAVIEFHDFSRLVFHSCVCCVCIVRVYKFVMDASSVVNGHVGLPGHNDPRT